MLNIEKMNELGATDYYLDLRKYIDHFIRKNYPLSAEDIKAITLDQTTPNIEAMQQAREVMEDEAATIIAGVMKENEQFLKDLNEGKFRPAKTQSDYDREIYDYKQQLLERLYNHKNSMTDETAKSK